MKRHSAFTLVELIVATMIFSFMSLSMLSIYYAANKHVFQNYRSDKVKADLSTAMRAVGSVLAQSTRIDSPAKYSSGNVLLTAANVESGSSPCYPMVSSSFDSSAPAPTWHMFCVTGGNLYYYSGNISYSSANACPNPTVTSFSNPGAGVVCGSTGNNMMLLASNITTAQNIFSREITSVTRLTNPSTVRVFLNTKWNTNRSVNATQNPVDHTLEGYFTVIEPR